MVRKCGGRKQVSKRSAHARPGMHMQQCSVVPQDHWYDTNVLPYNQLHLMGFVLSVNTTVFACYKTEKGTLMLLSFTHVTLRLLALLGQVTWTGTVCFRGGVWDWVYLNGHQGGLLAAKRLGCV